MPEASDKQAILKQNLMDAGCDVRTIDKCMKLAEKKQEAELLKLLFHQKGVLLNTVHQHQKRIDCLDFLVYQIERGNVILK